MTHCRKAFTTASRTPLRYVPPVFLYRTVRVIAILYCGVIKALFLFADSVLTTVRNTISASDSFIWIKSESVFCFHDVTSYSLSFSPTICGFLELCSLFVLIFSPLTCFFFSFSYPITYFTTWRYFISYLSHIPLPPSPTPLYVTLFTLILHSLHYHSYYLPTACTRTLSNVRTRTRTILSWT